MKLRKTAALLSLAVLGTVLQSQTSAAAEVSIYGLIDMGLEVYDNGDTTAVRQSSGLREGSRIGIQGTEKLTDAGTEVFFRLESTVFADTGEMQVDDRLFDREALLGVRGDFGSLSFGRQYTPFFLTMAMTDPAGMGMSSAGGYYGCPAWEGTMNGFGPDETTRFSNAIVYETPRMNGLKVKLFASLGEERASDFGGDSDSVTRGNVYSVGFDYAAGALSVLSSWLRINTRASGFDNWDNYYALGVAYDFGVTKPSLLFVHRDGDDTAYGRSFDGIAGSPDLYMLQGALATPVAGGTLITTAAMLRNNSVEDGDAWSWGVRYDYPLSRAVMLYGCATGIYNGEDAQYNIGGGGSSSPGMPVAFGDDPKVLYGGLMLRF